jgi:uncharacterized metal-binding protein YceD (DUF177 family)
LKISLEELRALPQQRARVSFKEELPIKEAIKPVTGDLTISANASGARVAGTVQALLKLMCHSCLRPFFQALHFELDEPFVYEDYLRGEEKDLPHKELNSKDFVESIAYNSNLDISDILYQAVTLATPLYCLCGADCPGPPAYQGTNERNDVGQQEVKAEKQKDDFVDPRWKNLKTLFPNEESH